MFQPSGPRAATILCDIGADVIKVENSNGGDDASGWMSPGWSRQGAPFQPINRYKRSVTLDFLQQADDDRPKSLILSAAVHSPTLEPDR